MTLVNYAAVTHYLVVDWGRAGSTTALAGLTATSTSLSLNLANVGHEHFVQIGPQQLDLTTLASAPTLVPDPTTLNGLFAIAHAGIRLRTENFNRFADFVTALTQDLNGTTAVIDVAATGQYDTAKDTFVSSRIAILLSH